MNRPRHALRVSTIAALSFGQAEDPTGWQEADVGSQEVVGLGPEHVVVPAVALLPALLRRRLVPWLANTLYRISR